MRVVMTGATSGIGLVAAGLLIGHGADLVVGARRPERAPEGLRGARILPLDLADLASVNAFADRLGEAQIDRLVCNAGLQVTSDQRSAQGFEVTFAANHLAHHRLIRRLTPRLAPQARIILTSSATHDPALQTSMPAPLHADARMLALPETDPQRDRDPAKAVRRAYSSSKLANVMTALELSRRLAAERPDVAIMAFDPGFTPGTGLARDYPGPVDLLFRHLLRFFVRGDHVSTPALSGACLAALVTDAEFDGARGTYFSVRAKIMRQAAPSVLARDASALAKLWDDSAGLTDAA